MTTERKDRISLIALTVVFILINLPPDFRYIASFKGAVLIFGYILGGCILSALGGVIISAIISAGFARFYKRHMLSLDTAKLILISSIAVGILLKIKK